MSDTRPYTTKGFVQVLCAEGADPALAAACLLRIAVLYSARGHAQGAASFRQMALDVSGSGGGA
jgi:hypothetical protein